MTFSYDDYQASIRTFATRVPELLLRHPSTAALALEISRLNLPQALESRFTIAIIGQMRSGKSTLLNALIGRHLAPVSIKETTATINIFRHGSGEMCDKFRVHWKDGSDEDRPLSDVDQWIGQSENARRTRTLDFFAASDFLTRANIIDAPGTRSTIESHEETVTGIIARELEEATLQMGGRADAIVYVVNPVAKVDDLRLLQTFGENTRLPGASAYNSIAVVQKWEHLRPDPLAKAQQMCDRMRQQFDGQVADVIPGSGYIAIHAIDVPLPVWQQVAGLAVESTAEAFDDLSSGLDYFYDEIDGAALDAAARRTLAAALPWPMLSFALWLARKRQVTSGEALRAALLQAANLDRLKEILQARFLSLAGLIQASTALRKAWQPCQTGMLKFREQIEHRRGLQQAGTRALQLVRERGNGLDPVLDFVRDSLRTVEQEITHLAKAHGELDELFHQGEQNFRLLDADVDCLQLLEADDKIEPEERRALQALFGQNGPEIFARLGLSETAGRDAALDVAGDRHGTWRAKQIRAQDSARQLYTHAVERLETIMDALEAEGAR